MTFRDYITLIPFDKLGQVWKDAFTETPTSVQAFQDNCTTYGHLSLDEIEKIPDEEIF